MKKTVEKIKKLVKTPSIFYPEETYHFPSLREVPCMASIVFEVQAALNCGIEPKKLTIGSSEVYLMYNREHKELAIFKPKKEFDESGYLRECAAFRLDTHNFAGVPETVVATFVHPMIGGKRKGSCQLFIEGHSFQVQNWQKVENVSASSIRRIAAFDIRVVNADRHVNNLLKFNRDIIPIDHNLILPSHLFMGPFVWLQWNEAKTPFSSDEKEYILNLDPRSERMMLMKEFKIEKKAADLFYLCSQLLKKGVASGLTAYDVGKLMSKTVIENGEKKEWIAAPLEKIAEKLGYGMSDNWGWFQAAVDEELDCLIGLTSNGK